MSRMEYRQDLLSQCRWYNDSVLVKDNAINSVKVFAELIILLQLMRELVSEVREA